MYSRSIHIYFVACSNFIISILKSLSPLPQFTHAFYSVHDNLCERIEAPALFIIGEACSEADLKILIQKIPAHAQIILLARSGASVPVFALSRLSDMWRLPMKEEEIKFHFSRWQNGFLQGCELAQTRQFLDCVMDASPNLIWFKDREGKHQLVNANFCRTVNKTREQVQGRGHAYIWDVEEDDPACIESERIVMESGATHVSEEEIVTGAGHRLLTTYKAPVRDPAGQIVGTMGIGVDITNERKYQRDLIENNTTLEKVFTNMDCGILAHTLDGKRVLSANSAALRLLGFDSLEALNADFDQVASTVISEDKKKVGAAIDRLHNVGDYASYEYRVIHKDGKYVHIMGSARLVEKNGQVVCQRFLLDCTAQKIAEKRNQEEKERRQEELIRALSTDFQLVCVYGVREESTRILQLAEYPDPNLKEIFEQELPLDEKIKKYIETCVHPEDQQACAEAFSLSGLQAILEEEPIYYFTYRTINNGHTHYYRMKAVRIDLGDAIVMGLQSVDKSARKEMEQKDMLAEALKRAERASNAKSIFLSNMSHDIRTPMNAVLGYATLARRHITEPWMVEGYLKKIQDSGSHLISLINDILDMSHIESGKVKLEENSLNLSELLQEIFNIVEPGARDKDQTLNLDIASPEHEDIICDKLRFKQIMLNLLGNSVKYTPRNGEITVSVKELDCPHLDHATYEFRIKDNGMGMSAEFLEHIFEPFERAQNSTIAGIQGTGLGMAIVKNIVDLMRGEIQVQSELGIGTEFILTLTFRIQESKDWIASAPVSAPEPESGQRRGHILLAEDNEMNQEIAVEFLQSAGYEVDVAENGQQAVEMLTAAGAGYYDIVLMDVQMPVMNGYQATGIIRSLPDPGLAKIPIIAMTANSFEEDRQEALNNGMNAHVAKPIDFKILFAAMDEFGR